MTKEQNDDKALSFVGKIMDAYKAAEIAGATALRHALECGKYLKLAFENVEEAKGKGKWNQWRKQNLSDVSEETERVYRRLAEAVAKKEYIFAKCKSIRAALQHLAGLDENLNAKPAPVPVPKQKGSGSSATGLSPPEADTPSTGGLEAELGNAGADEIITCIQDDADKLEELAKASIAKLTPDKVCDTLKAAWTADQVRDLSRRLTAYLTTLGATPPPTDQSSSFRRPAAS